MDDYSVMITRNELTKEFGEDVAKAIIEEATVHGTVREDLLDRIVFRYRTFRRSQAAEAEKAADVRKRFANDLIWKSWKVDNLSDREVCKAYQVYLQAVSMFPADRGAFRKANAKVYAEGVRWNSKYYLRELKRFVPRSRGKVQYPTEVDA